MRHVPAEGPEDAKIMVIGECPGEKEEKEGRPFVGLAGRVLDGLLEECGLARGSCYITNVYKYRPRGNQFNTIDKNALTKAYSELEMEISAVQPNVIVLCGNEAMRAVLGYIGVNNWRGSVVKNKAGVKCIPVFHPAAISRDWKMRPLTAVDFKRVKSESEFSEVKQVKRTMSIQRHYETVLHTLEVLRTCPYHIAFDIEVERQQVCCIAFSYSPTHSVCIPFWFGASGSFFSTDQEQEIWKRIKVLMEDENIPKIAQNAQYDMSVLREKYGINTRGLWLDTMIAFHAVYPELPKSLAVLTSLYTDVPYYKYQRHASDMDTFFRYNAMDACVTHEIAFKVYEEMEEAGVKEFYYEHMHSLIDPLMQMGMRGVKIDRALKKGAVKQYKEELVALEELLPKQVGHTLNVQSHKQMTHWLYEELKVPKLYRVRKGRGTRTLAADEEALHKIASVRDIPALETILQMRNKKKLLSTYLEVVYDKVKTEEGNEERARTSYLITGTETGRLASRQTHWGTGTNLQNIPKGICRRIFVPDEGKLFINADLSQAEARVVAYLADETRLISIFECGGDIHRKNAANIFRKDEEDVTKGERTLAKRIIHASNYGMGPVTFSKTCGVTVSEAKRLLNAYFAEYPRIKRWHLYIQQCLKRSRTLTTPLGRKRTFFNRWDASLVKEAYAYIPQSTVADVLNKGLRCLYEKTRGSETELLLQVHDSVLLQTPHARVETEVRRVKSCLTIPIDIGGKTLTIPVDVSIGENWEELKTWKQ